MRPPHVGIPLFVATRPEDVPSSCRHFLSVDGSVPGAAVTWDHHVTGEAINLDAMPECVDPSAFDGIGTTMADTDAVASVVAALFGGKANLPASARAVLAAASYRCDHLRPHPGCSEEVNELGRGLHGHVVRRLRQGEGLFSTVCRELTDSIAAGQPLPFDTSGHDAQREAVRALELAGRIRDDAPVALVDLRGREHVDPEALYERLSCPVAVVVEDHAAGGLRYTVGLNPTAHPPLSSVRSALVLIAGAEHAHGPPCRAPEPRPGSENWGGRETVFGSPWNYGSRLTPEEVVALVARGLSMT